MEKNSEKKKEADQGSHQIEVDAAAAEITRRVNGGL